jgi:aminoglycoside/choline kinase family phosphotransferase
MVVPGRNPGILDFQDAVVGPITYDLVSLLRDCYIAWPRERVEAWALDHRQACLDAGLITAVSEADWLRWFDWMGLQRHLKVAGIFSRLNLRDNKPGYLDDIPLVMRYLHEVSSQYEEMAPLTALIAEVAPA